MGGQGNTVTDYYSAGKHSPGWIIKPDQWTKDSKNKTIKDVAYLYVLKIDFGQVSTMVILANYLI